MKYLFTSLYNEFECIGDKCSDTCCAGWRILVDQKTYDKYCSLEEENKNWICSRLKKVENNGKILYEIEKDEKDRCPFLNEKNLCQIILKISEDYLCNTCKTYPRKTVVYHDAFFATVSVSCPEVARNIVQMKDKLGFHFTEDEEGCLDVDWILYNELINGLVIAVDILQNREYPLLDRYLLLLLLLEQMQVLIEQNKITEIRQTADRYRDQAYRKSILDGCKNAFLFPINIYDCLCYFMEPAIDFFKVQNTRSYPCIEKAISELNETMYQEWLDKYQELSLDIEFENLAVQFTFEYFMDALKGKSLYHNVLKLFLLQTYIKAQQVFIYGIKGSLSEEDRIAVISQTSRIFEHSKHLDFLVDKIMEDKSKMDFIKLLFCLK